jgi:hypothetical protein
VEVTITSSEAEIIEALYRAQDAFHRLDVQAGEPEAFFGGLTSARDALALRIGRRALRRPRPAAPPPPPAPGEPNPYYPGSVNYWRFEVGMAPRPGGGARMDDSIICG